MSATDKVLEHVEGVQKRGNGFWALCPAHEDHTPSLHIQEGDDGRALFICRAGCDQPRVIAALKARGLKPGELFAEERRISGPLKAYKRSLRAGNVSLRATPS